MPHSLIPDDEKNANRRFREKLKPRTPDRPCMESEVTADAFQTNRLTADTFDADTFDADSIDADSIDADRFDTAWR